ncbi:RlpA-like double-psi beta-barrel-protein domain-containing protein-containing protein [Pholiota molesta]|nr:RlpA-like double-psi beta-barrel-protein domain-containing protein-containing protein [Pholiota molesta]
MQLFKGLSTYFVASAMLAQVAYAFSGDATYYNTGLGSCGVTNKDTDFVVALSSAEAAHGKHCGKRIRVHYQGRTVEATVEDTCPGCSQYSIDLTPAAFKKLAPLDAGRIKVTWEYI